MTSGLLALSARLIVAALFLAAIVPAYRHAELSYLRENDPQRALDSHPADARALTRVIAERLAADPANTLAAAETDNLRRSLIDRPLSADLLAIQGLNAQVASQPDQALTAMRLADRISRRSSLASLWLIEAASNAGDVPGAVGHYHNALSVHPPLRNALLPLLARGLVYPEIRAALSPYIARPANWTGDFLQIAAKESSPADLQALLSPLPAALRDEAFQPLLGSLLERLAAEAEPEAAAGFAADLVPGLDPRALSVLAPSPQTLDPRLGALAWRFPEDKGGIASRAVQGGVLEIEVQPLANGLAAHRGLLVEGGKTYGLSQRVSISDAGSDLGLTWRGSCKAGDEAIGFWEKRLSFGSSDIVGPLLLEVPFGCRAVTLALMVEGPDAQMPVTVKLSQLELKALD